MIKRFNDFMGDKINENKNDSDFLEKFDQLIEELKDWYSSFTRIVNRNDNIELSHHIKEVGLTWDEIEKNKNLIFDNLDKYSSINGGVDYLLYLLSDHKYILGGFDINLDSNIDELVVKYEYGYHLNSYGEKYLLQCFDSLGDYYDCILENLIYVMSVSKLTSNFDRFFKPYHHQELLEISQDVMSKINGVWFLNSDKFYDHYMGNFKDEINHKRGEDHPQKVFNILTDLVDQFFEKDIENQLIETEGVEDTLIKISFT